MQIRNFLKRAGQVAALTAALYAADGATGHAEARGYRPMVYVPQVTLGAPLHQQHVHVAPRGGMHISGGYSTQGFAVSGFYSSGGIIYNPGFSTGIPIAVVPAYPAYSAYPAAVPAAPYSSQPPADVEGIRKQAREEGRELGYLQSQVESLAKEVDRLRARAETPAPQAPPAPVAPPAQAPMPEKPAEKKAQKMRYEFGYSGVICPDQFVAEANALMNVAFREHGGELRAYAGTGVTIVRDKKNKPFLTDNYSDLKGKQVNGPDFVKRVTEKLRSIEVDPEKYVEVTFRNYSGKCGAPKAAAKKTSGFRTKEE